MPFIFNEMGIYTVMESKLKKQIRVALTRIVKKICVSARFTRAQAEPDSWFKKTRTFRYTCAKTHP